MGTNIFRIFDNAALQVQPVVQVPALQVQPVVQECQTFLQTARNFRHHNFSERISQLFCFINSCLVNAESCLVLVSDVIIKLLKQ